MLVRTLATLLLFLSLPTFVWQHLLIDAALLTYVFYAARAGAAERERAAKVTELRLVGPQSTVQPTFLRAVGDR